MKISAAQLGISVISFSIIAAAVHTPAQNEPLNKSAALINLVPPLGSITIYSGIAAPDAQVQGGVWILCDGRELNQIDFPELFEALSFTYGPAGTGKFRIPDLRGRIALGKTDMGSGEISKIIGDRTANPQGVDGKKLGSIGGEELHKLIKKEMPTHDHSVNTMTAGAHDHKLEREDGSTISWSGDSGDSKNRIDSAGVDEGKGIIRAREAGAHFHAIHPDGGGASHNNLQPSIVLNYLIRVK